jgi:hypothetical protein
MLGLLIRVGVNDTKALVFVPGIFQLANELLGILWYIKICRTWRISVSPAARRDCTSFNSVLND